ncbi:hypothetical protein MKW92_010976 [Papaver armeniacum]|nr:hypothetical protein MKW92_010976 [Papaver armeniacum]
MNSIEFPVLDQSTQNSFISTTSNDLSNWSRLSSLWPLLYSTSCFFIKFASVIGSRCETMKMPPSLVRLYEQMLEPKYVIKLILVVYFPGCPPKPVAVIDAITKLCNKVSREIYEDILGSQYNNRCFITTHKFMLDATRILEIMIKD